MFSKLIIANRGEIAIRIMRTARALGVRTAAVYSDADHDAQHVALADEAWRIGPAPAAMSYLNTAAILEAARRSGADALHPGYGFLSENAAFAEAVIAAGVAFVGPPPEAMRIMGLKDEARRIMTAAGVPVIPGYDGAEQSAAKLAEAAMRIGYPVLIKPLAGGGGRGMRIVRGAADFAENLAAAQHEATAAFGDPRVLLEKYLPAVRHIEVQVMADRHGTVLHLWERDCSLQRRHQKVIEEAPAPGLPHGLRTKMCDAAVEAARRVNYEGAGTVEFLAPLEEGVLTGDFYFIEMNTRLQVEHPVTEAVTGLDLVALQLQAAAGERLGLAQDAIPCDGHAIEARIYAENPEEDFAPQSGAITMIDIPTGSGLRFDGSLCRGDHVTPHYDAMIGKLISHAASRKAALLKLQDAVLRSRIEGLTTNLPFLADLLQRQDVTSARTDTALIGRSLEEATPRALPPPHVLAAAVLVHLGRTASSPNASVFGALKGFQLWGGSRTVTLACRGRTLRLEVVEAGEDLTLSYEGGALTFTLLRAAVADMWLASEGRVSHLLWQDDGAAITIVSEGERFAFARPSPEAAAPDGAGARVIVSPVPGRLARLMVSDGEAVSAGDTVAVIEAMKTLFSLRAEAGGAIRLHVEEGKQVRQGEIIADIGERDG